MHLPKFVAERDDKESRICYWKIAKDFFEKSEKDDAVIYYSGFLLKELKFILDEKEFYEKREKFEKSPNFLKIDISKDELNHARKIESELGFEVSFYDILHMLMAKKAGAVLITRDKKLIQAARYYDVEVKRPEEEL